MEKIFEKVTCDLSEAEKGGEMLKYNLLPFEESVISLFTENAERVLGKAYVSLNSNGELSQDDDIDFLIGLVILTDQDIREAMNVTRRQMELITSFRSSEEQNHAKKIVRSVIQHPSVEREVNRIKNILQEDPQEATKLLGRARLAYARI